MRRRRQYICEHCGKVFRSGCSLKFHVLHHEGKLLLCSQCPARFPSARQLENHMLVHTKANPTKTLTKFGTVKYLSIRNQRHRCDHCPRTFQTIKGILKHIKIRHTKWGFRCTRCMKMFKTKGWLRMHKATHCVDQPNWCRICIRGFYQVSVLNLHTISHNLTKPYLCTVCASGFTLKPMLKVHMKSHQPKKANMCEDCHKSFPDAYRLMRHIQYNHTRERPFACRYCGKRFPFWRPCQIHETIHTGEKPHKCTYDGCDKSYRQKSALTIHLRTHTGERPFRCNQCSLAFREKSHLSSHMWVHERGKTYKCRFCPEKFETIKDRTDHQDDMHHDERPLKCPICNKGYDRKYNLNLHMATHTGIKPYPCTECDKSYSTPTVLRYHMRTHTGHKPYVCVTCGETFRIYDHLKVHLRKHTGEKPFACDQCNYRTAFRGGLTRHMRTHAEKPFSCGTCTIGFRTRDAAKAHEDKCGIPKPPPGKPVKCQVCKMRFVYQKSLDEHVKLHTGEKKSDFVCHCGKLFVREKDYKRHLLLHSGMKAYHCGICQKAFKRKGPRDIHLVTAHPTGPYAAQGPPFKCKSCPKVYPLRKGLIRHVLGKHNITGIKSEDLQGSDEEENLENIRKEVGFFRCDTCGKDFQHKWNLTTHIKARHTGDLKKPYSCQYCQKAFQRPADLVRHNRTHTKERPYKCKLCKKGFTQKYWCRYHELRCKKKPGEVEEYVEPENTPTDFQCSVCNKYLKNKTNLEIHCRIHTGERPYACDLCDASFNASSTLKRHLEAHAGLKPYECVICLKRFRQKAHCQAHESRCTGSADKELLKYECNVCGQRFKIEAALEKHEKLHLNEAENPYPCTFCSMSFRSPSHRDRHLVVHTGETPFKCQHCHKGFTRSYSRNNHEMLCARRSNSSKHFPKRSAEREDVPNKVKPESAGSGDGVDLDTVSDTTDDDNQDYNHDDNHSENKPKKPYPCNFCPKSFISPSHKERHEVLHTGERPFTCRYCLKGFTRKYGCDIHERQCSAKRTDSNEVGVQSSEGMNIEIKTEPVEDLATGEEDADTAYHDENNYDENNDENHHNDENYQSEDSDFRNEALHKAQLIVKSIGEYGEKPSQDRSLHTGVRNVTFQVSSPPSDVDDDDNVDNKGNGERKLQNNSADNSSSGKIQHKFACPLCPKSYPQKRSLWRHMKLHVNGREIYEKHLREEDERNRAKRQVPAFSCPVCPKSYPHRRSLYRHIVNHENGLQIYQKLFGDNGARASIKTDDHVIAAVKSEPETCDDHPTDGDGKDDHFSPAEQLTSPLSEVEGEPTVCRYCEEQCKSQPNLRIHQLSTGHYQQEEFVTDSSYYCPDCNQGPFTRPNLFEHLSLHSQAAGMVCVVCGNVYEDHGELRTHIAEHVVRSVRIKCSEAAGSMHVECQRCIKGFSDAQNLVRHISLH